VDFNPSRSPGFVKPLSYFEISYFRNETPRGGFLGPLKVGYFHGFTRDWTFLEERDFPLCVHKRGENTGAFTRFPPYLKEGGGTTPAFLLINVGAFQTPKEPPFSRGEKVCALQQSFSGGH